MASNKIRYGNIIDSLPDYCICFIPFNALPSNLTFNDPEKYLI